MRNLYTLGIRMMVAGIRLGSKRSPKLRQQLKGQEGLFSRLEAFRSVSSMPICWVHVASLGEYEQAKPVIAKFKSTRPTYRVVVSFFSPSGYEHVVKRPQANVDLITYLPFDTPQNAERFISVLKPAVGIFVKYDLWANHILAANSAKIPLFLIAASFRKEQVYFKPYGGLFRKLLQTFTHIFTQLPLDEADKTRLGIDSVSAAGDPRYDNVEATRANPKAFPDVEKGIYKPVLVAGSVWQEDMDLIIPYIAKNSGLQYIIAPHDIHSGKINEWKEMLPGKVVRYSELEHAQGVWDTLIIDNIGMLASLYRYATFAYVGGAFGKGLHNILEPLAFRIPVLFGKLKNRGKFPEWEISQQYGCGFAVTNASELDRTMQALSNPADYQTVCGHADRLVKDNLGSAERIVEEINFQLPID